VLCLCMLLELFDNLLIVDFSLLVLEFRVHRLVELQKHVLAFKVRNYKTV